MTLEEANLILNVKPEDPMEIIQKVSVCAERQISECQKRGRYCSAGVHLPSPAYGLLLQILR